MVFNFFVSSRLFHVRACRICAYVFFIDDVMAKKSVKINSKSKKGGLFSSLKEAFVNFVGFFRNPNTQFVIGMLFAAFAIFLCSSFISFFSSGGDDYTALEAISRGAGEDVVASNTSGKGGAVVAYYLINRCFGWASLLLLPMVALVALKLMRIGTFRLWRWLFMLFYAMVWFSLLFSFVFGERLGISYVSPGGAHGDFLNAYLTGYLGVVGVVLLLLLAMLLFMVYVSRKTIPWLRSLLSYQGGIDAETEERRVRNMVVTDDAIDDEPDDEPDDADEYADEEDEGENADVEEDEEAEGVELEINVGDEVDEESETDIPEAVDDEIEIDDDALAKEFDKVSQGIAAGDGGISMEVKQVCGDDDMGGDMLRPINPKDELSYYKPPTIDLLDEYEQSVQAIDKNEQSANANKIVEVLKNFGIEISSIKATVGPTITLYEITPAPGVRIAKIRNLEDDIAISLSALCIRIVAPIPGKGTIGIEVPNKHKQIVPMASLLNSRKYKETDMALPLALGKTISNEVYMVDMAKMPHLLVAGATGMGKSVGLNAIITSLLYKMHPAYLKFVMVDPKMVELSLYGVLEKHFLAKLEGEDEPIITDVNKVVRTLKSLCVEMDNRYKLLRMASVRSVKEYNEKFLNKELLPTKGHRFMPYIVVIIDEYGDLMMTAGREVEQPIARIAQKARAVGIHMIIATQRPTTNIITGTIKANFPARMAFRVISVIDSRTILDRSGANQLQGRGDMLFLAGNDPVRVQCALVETKEVERVCSHIAKQQGYQTAYILPEPDESTELGGDGGGGMRGDISSDKLDPLFVDAARAVVLAQHGSTSLIQRKFNVGFNRAGRIMDQLCQTGIVGEQEGSKPRQVLCSDEADLEFRLKSLL